MKRISLGYASGGKVDDEMFLSVVGFILHDGSEAGRHTFAGLFRGRQLYVPTARNIVVRQFLEVSKADYLLFIDTDIQFQPSDVYGLLDIADERTVVGGLYFGYFNGHLLPTWLDWTGTEYRTLKDTTRGEIREVGTLGMGFTLIPRELLEAMATARPNDHWAWFGHDYLGNHPEPMGEDLTFCHRARALGYKIVGHGGVVLNHYKTRAENFDTFAAYWSRLQQSGEKRTSDSNHGSAVSQPTDGR